VRILHLTDLHLRHHQAGTAGVPERLSRDMPRVLVDLADRMPTLDVDAVVISGDLLDVPDEVLAGESPNGFDRSEWLTFVENDLQLVRSWLIGLGIGYVICSGNHDHEPSIRRVFPEAADFVDIAGIRFFSFWDELGPDRQPRRTGARLDLFERALTEPEHDLPQVHVQHYIIDPPTTRNNWRYEYLGAQNFKQKLEASGRVRAVLSGHYHPGIWVTSDKVVYSGPPAFCEPPHAFRIYELDDYGNVLIEEHAVSEQE